MAKTFFIHYFIDRHQIERRIILNVQWMRSWCGHKQPDVLCLNSIPTCRIQSWVNRWENYGSKYQRTCIINYLRMNDIIQILFMMFSMWATSLHKYVHLYTHSYSSILRRVYKNEEKWELFYPLYYTLV